ncbi:MAG: PAS sensor histidine kinase [Halonotius sp. J07HN6]|jgi:PAS domain S-box|nr:MAG: PAS sensor histidine kinase [Halonotius sp. J07HN6]
MSYKNNHPEDVQKFEYLFSLIRDAIVEIEIVEREPIVRSVNPAFENIFGYTPEEVRGESLNEFIVPQGHENEAARLDSRTDDGKYNEATLTRMTADGAREFLYRGVPYEQDGSQYAFAVYSDITEQKRREAEVERKNQQLDEFASILTHDLRNPINIAQGYLNQLKGSGNEECIELIEQAHDRMNAIIDETLTLTKESEAVDEVSPESITEVAESSWELVETNGSKLRIDDEFELFCDSDRFNRLLENLFRNAIDHNDEPVKVRIGIQNTMATVAGTGGIDKAGFYIEDDGQGIPKEKHDQVFKIGETTSREGTGLGLPIAKRIAEAHGWEMKIAESADGGAKFIFTNVDLQ